MKRQDFVLRGNGGPEPVRLEGDADSWRFTRNGETLSFSAVPLPDGRWSILLSDGRQLCGRASPKDGGSVEVVTSAGRCHVQLDDPLHDLLSHSGDSGHGSGEDEVRALMPGRVVEVRVAKGDRVEPGNVLLVLEAMKMQNEIRASSGGRVSRCAVSAGDAVEGGALLFELDLSPNP
jgi:biotin carboxyl carrier protein